MMFSLILSVVLIIVSLKTLSHIEKEFLLLKIKEEYIHGHSLSFRLTFWFCFLFNLLSNGYFAMAGQILTVYMLYYHVYKPYTYIVKIPIEEHKTPEKTGLGVYIPFFASKSYLFGSNYLYGRFSVYEDFIVVIIPLEETKVFARSDLECLEEKIWQQRFFIKFRDGSVYTISERQTEFIQFLQKIVQENQDKANAKS